jgi:hypothetical protein
MVMGVAWKVPDDFLLRDEVPRFLTREKLRAWKGKASRRGRLPTLALEPECLKPTPL